MTAAEVEEFLNEPGQLLRLGTVDAEHMPTGDGEDRLAVWAPKYYHVSDRIEWWTAPNKIAQALEFAKAEVTGGTADMGESGTLEV